MGSGEPGDVTTSMEDYFTNGLCQKLRGESGEEKERKGKGMDVSSYRVEHQEALPRADIKRTRNVRIFIKSGKSNYRGTKNCDINVLGERGRGGVYKPNLF